MGKSPSGEYVSTFSRFLKQVQDISRESNCMISSKVSNRSVS